MLRRRWWLLVLAAVIGLLLAVDVPGLGPKTYVATAGVLVLPTGVDSASGAGGRTGGAVDLGAEARLLRSVEVATRAKALLKVADDPRELAANVTVDVPPDTWVLNISYRAATPQDARRSAQAFARAYLDYRAAVATAKVKADAAALRAQITQARKQLEEVAGKKAALPQTSPGWAEADARGSVLINRIAQLSGDLSPLEAVLATEIMPGRVINSAKLPAGD